MFLSMAMAQPCTPQVARANWVWNCSMSVHLTMDARVWGPRPRMKWRKGVSVGDTYGERRLRSIYENKQNCEYTVYTYIGGTDMFTRKCADVYV